MQMQGTWHTANKLTPADSTFRSHEHAKCQDEHWTHSSHWLWTDYSRVATSDSLIFKKILTSKQQRLPPLLYFEYNSSAPLEYPIFLLFAMNIIYNTSSRSPESHRPYRVGLLAPHPTPIPEDLSLLTICSISGYVISNQWIQNPVKVDAKSERYPVLDFSISGIDISNIIPGVFMSAIFDVWFSCT